ncbi:hypothetical protein DRQ18_01415 [bacterium]|nr:MAG: hypothetical protein DRQ18_01415 [bacterium]
MILLFALTFDRLALVVEDKAFTLSEIRREALFYPGASLSEVANMLLEEELLVLEAESETVEVSSEELEDALKRMRENFPDEEEWLRNLSLIKRKVRNQLIIQKLMQKKGLPVITDMDALRFYNEKRDSLFIPAMVRLERYSVSLHPADREEKKKEAERFAQRLRKGEGWEKMKDMGWVDVRELPPEFREVGDMDDGEMRVLEAPDGFYVIACMGRRENYIQLKMMAFNFEFTQKDYERGREEAERIREKWLSGEAPDGVEEMGEIPVEALNPALVSLIDTIPEGGVTRPVFDAGKFYLIKVVEKKEKEYPPFEMIKDKIKNILFSREMEKRYRKEVEALKEKYYVKILL